MIHRRIQCFFLWVLPYVARFHPKNWNRRRFRYPQLWYCMPKRWVELKDEFYENGNRKLRRAKPRIVLEHICGFLTGHELSATETGYGGGQYIDKNCRWCDKAIQVPLSECDVSPQLGDLMGMVGKEIEPDADLE